MATRSPVSSPESGLSTTTAIYENAFQKFKPARPPADTQPVLADSPRATAQPNWDVLATFALPGTKDLNPLLSPILFDSLSESVRPHSTARTFESHAPPSSLREYEDSSSPIIFQRSPNDEPWQSHLDKERDIIFSADEFPTRTSSEIIPERGLCPTPASIHRAETLRSDDPQRKLSYGPKLNMPHQKSLPGGTGSRQLRRKAGWSIENGNASPGVRRSSNSFRVSQSPMFCKADSKDLSPPQRKMRLETSTSESGESIKQAYITTVTSPSKPQIISIARRSSALQDTTSLQYESNSVSNAFPVTLPETPAEDQEVRNGISEVLEPKRTHRIGVNPSDKIKVRVTPSNTPLSSYRITEFHQSDVSYESSRNSVHTSLRHQPLDWILDELEFTVASFPTVRLQLNSPVIQHLRLPNADRLVTGCRLGNAPSSSKAPHSRYSIFRPLSSHPVTPRSPQVPRDVLLQDSDLSIINALHPDPHTDPTLRALQTIFPNAELPALECLQATYLALNYLSLSSPPSFAHPRFLSSSPGAECPLNLSTVPPKARAMLGIALSTSIPPTKTFYYPQTSEHGEDRLRERIGELVVRLRGMVGDLLDEIGEKRPGLWDYEFLTALGEVIKMGEERGK